MHQEDSSKKLDKEQAEKIHTVAAKVLFVSKRACVDTQAVTGSCTVCKIFDSFLFNKTDHYKFRKGYENQQKNLCAQQTILSRWH